MEELVGDFAFAYECSYTEVIDVATCAEELISVVDPIKKIVDWENLPSRQFQKHFRMNKDSFDVLMGKLLSCPSAATHFPIPGKGSNPLTVIRPQLRTLMGLWYLGTPDSMRSIASNFGVEPSTVFDSTSALCSLMTELEAEYVKWPSEAQQRIAMAHTWKASRLAGVVGAVDGTHIKITRPRRDQRVYFNRKKEYSLNVMIAVDSSEKVIYYSLGCPGSFHDARVFRMSGLPDKLDELPPERHILGDSAYKHSIHVIAPYKDTGRLTQDRRKFNRHHSTARITVEHVFGRLKQKWRRLYSMDVRSIRRAKLLIRATIVTIHPSTISYYKKIVKLTSRHKSLAKCLI